jgi:hypothetical protein
VLAKQIPSFTDEELSRFWNKVEQTDTCWNWSAATNPSNYSVFTIAGKGTFSGHRIAFKLITGDDHTNKILRHTCNNRRCVNPGHLVPGTVKENAEDRVRSGSSKNPGVGVKKLSPADVILMRAQYHSGLYKMTELARLHNVTLDSVYKAVSARTWAELPLRPTQTDLETYGAISVR